VEKIMLGDKVRCIVSGHIGIAVARTEFLNGCVQYSVAGKLKSGEKLSTEGEPSIDEMCLEVIQKKVIKSKEYEDEKENVTKEKKKSNGGPVRFIKGMRGY